MEYHKCTTKLMGLDFEAIVASPEIKGAEEAFIHEVLGLVEARLRMHLASDNLGGSPYGWFKDQVQAENLQPLESIRRLEELFYNEITFTIKPEI